MQQTEKILATLAKDFPNAKSELNFKNPFQLLVAVILSAQCTDKRVNLVTPALFAEADTPEKMAALPVGRIEELIHSCGFYHSKAKYLHDMSVDVVTRFGGVVPNNIDELRTLAGVGRKTANVVYAVGFGGQAIAVDTHVFRVALPTPKTCWTPKNNSWLQYRLRSGRTAIITFCFTGVTCARRSIRVATSARCATCASTTPSTTR